MLNKVKSRFAGKYLPFIKHHRCVTPYKVKRTSLINKNQTTTGEQMHNKKLKFELSVLYALAVLVLFSLLLRLI